MTPAQAMDIGSRMINLLSQQQLLYRQLNELAQKQSDLVDGGDPEALLRILAGRQRLIDRLAALDRELRPIRADWQGVAESLPPVQRQQAQELVAGVQKILSEILDRDKRDTQALRDQQVKVAGQIRSTAAGKKMNQAYGARTAEPNSSYFDTQTTSSSEQVI
jgi:hypothetical protein